jgi:hypothetical protein
MTATEVQTQQTHEVQRDQRTGRMLPTAVAVGGLWLATALSSVFAPDLISDAQDHVPIVALYRIVIVRLRHDQRTKDYLTRRIQQGKTKHVPTSPAARPRARRRGRSNAASLAEYRGVTQSSGSWLLGRRQGTASLLCRQTASFSLAAPGAPRPFRPASGTCPVEGRTMKNRRQGPQPPAESRSHSRGEARCSSAGTGRAPPMT